MNAFDVIVIGAGGMGSAAAYHLTKRGMSVLLLEQYTIDHMNGSSYGDSRIIRYSYKDPEYIQLAKAVYPLWHELEADSGETLWHVTGGIDFGKPTERSLQDTIQSVQAANIPHEILTPAEAMARFPQFTFPDHFTVLYQPESGMLAPSKVVRTQVRLAQANGAQVRDETPVEAITVSDDTVTVRAGDETFTAPKLILTAGSWTNDALAMIDEAFQLPLTPLRCQTNLFETDDPQYTVAHMPAYIYHHDFDNGEGIYGIPNHDGVGLKASKHGGTPHRHPSEIDRTPDDATTQWVRDTIGAYLPVVAAAPIQTRRICLYTQTPDEHFIMDAHPHHPNVIIGAGFSGHGFKFSTGIGKILADLALDGSTPHDIRLWRINRLRQTPA